MVQVGDGTTSVVLLAGEILKHVKGFVEDGLHPQVGVIFVLVATVWLLNSIILRTT